MAWEIAVEVVAAGWECAVEVVAAGWECAVELVVVGVVATGVEEPKEVVPGGDDACDDAALDCVAEVVEGGGGVEEALWVGDDVPEGDVGCAEGDCCGDSAGVVVSGGPAELDWGSCVVVWIGTQSSEEFAPMGDVRSAGHSSQSP